MGKQKKEKTSKGNRSNPIARTSLGDQLESDRSLDPSDAKTRMKAKYNKDETEPEVCMYSYLQLVIGYRQIFHCA